MPRTRQAIRLFLAAAAVLICASAAAGPPDLAIEREVAASVNRHRVELGLAPLAWSDDAAELARAHSRDMAAGRVGLGHDGFAERWRSLPSELGASAAAENVLRQRRPGGSVGDVALAQWLTSAVHRRNLEGPFQLAGVGAARGADGSLYLTQIFVGVREGARSAPPSPPD